MWLFQANNICFNKNTNILTSLLILYRVNNYSEFRENILARLKSRIMHVLWISGIAFCYAFTWSHDQSIFKRKNVEYFISRNPCSQWEHNGIKEQKLLQQYYVLMYNNGQADYCYHILFGH